MWDAEHRSERLEMERLIVGCISSLGDETPWIEGHNMINKALLIFIAKFRWLLV